MRIVLSLLSLSCILFLNSCKVNKDVVDQCLGLRLDQQEFIEAKIDLVKIKSAEIQDDCLKLRFTVQGACDADGISMHWDYRVKKSKPAIARLKLAYAGKSDCPNKTEYSRNFELKELKNPAYKGKVLIKVNDWAENLEFTY
ncbi:MAG TPA: hypothetical protein DCS15_06475 [Flavobacteriales bacterium]|jgi:ribosomal protein S6E (S10)|nr:hypothetical protein [Salibacteraceae bacterium]HAS36114.1 hypothetical protein [Flavobacteriales bacterium]